jgi:hypothetical protein
MPDAHVPHETLRELGTPPRNRLEWRVRCLAICFAITSSLPYGDHPDIQRSMEERMRRLTTFTQT